MITTSFVLLSIGAIEPNPANPRKTFAEAALAELTESIKTHGVLQPVVVRPVGSGYQLICGERRWRGAQAAGLDTIPAVVRHGLSDDDALEIAVLENLQRQDLNPLEEAEGFAALIHAAQYTPDTLAEKLGKSRAHIYARLKLLKLAAPVRKLLEDGVIQGSVAELIGQLPPAAQSEFLDDYQLDSDSISSLSVREVRRVLEQWICTLDTRTPFDPEETSLVESAGPCSTCPKRSGNDPALLATWSAPHVCTDRACYKAKASAHCDRELSRKQKAGERVLRGEEAEGLFRPGLGNINWEYKGPWQTEECYVSSGRLGDLLKQIPKQTRQAHVAWAENGRGELTKLINRKTVEAAVRGGEAQASLDPGSPEGIAAAKKERQKANRAKCIERLLAVEALLHILDVAQQDTPEAFIHHLGLLMLSSHHRTIELEEDLRVHMLDLALPVAAGKPAEDLKKTSDFALAELTAAAADIFGFDAGKRRKALLQALPPKPTKTKQLK